MNMKLKLLSGLAVFAAAAFSLQAQTLSLNDISVGFSTGTSTNSLQAKAGSVSTLATYTTQTLIGSFNSSLNAVDATWATDGLLFWGAQGTASSTKVFGGSVWDTSTAGTLGTANSTAWSFGSVALGNTKIGGMNTTFGSVGVATGDGISRTVSNAQANSWKAQAIAGSSSFTLFNPSTQFAIAASATALGANYSAVDLYQVQSSNVSTFLGTFALYTSAGGGYSVGDLTFTAVPEPSTYAAILGVMTMGIVMIRRRRSSAQLAEIA